MLQDDAVRSAKMYLDYLTAHRDAGAGIVRYRVRSIQRSLLDGEMILFVDREIRLVDEIAIRVGAELFEHDPEEGEFYIQGHEKKSLTIYPSPELAEKLDTAFQNREKVYLESDIKFLVLRVMRWYERYGQLVALPKRRPVYALDPQNPIMLSDNQYECASMAVSSPLTYIWGAPGTGKTKHVLASCVFSCMKAGRKALLVAPTNNALEQSLSGVLQALTQSGQINPSGRILRLGAPGNLFRESWPDICESGALQWWKSNLQDQMSNLEYRKFLIESSFEIRNSQDSGELDPFPGRSSHDLALEKKRIEVEIRQLKRKYKEISESRNLSPVMDEFDVVAATVDTCLNRLPPDGMFHPDHVFLDEAGYCSVIKALTLTGYGSPLTMLGDHMQLPPVFENEAEILRLPNAGITRLWKISALYMENVVLVEDRQFLCDHLPPRPYFEHISVSALTETHRFGNTLARVLAGSVYGKRFHSVSDAETQICFIEAPKVPEDCGKDESGKYHRISRAEVNAVKNLILSNLSQIWYTVGIIAPYVNQRNLIADTIRVSLREIGYDGDMSDDIVTVHGSQGREWDIVLFCVTDRFDESFLTNSRRPESLKLINTAVSRARKKLILIGDSASWRNRNGQILSELFAIASRIVDTSYF